MRVAFHLIAIAIQVFSPLALGFWLIRRFKLKWGIFLVGILFFLLSQIAELPVVGIIGALVTLSDATVAQSLLRNPFFAATLTGLVAGVFEEISRFVGFRFMPIMQRNRTWAAALVSGAGHGGLESIFVGLYLLGVFVAGFVAPELFEALGIPGPSETAPWLYLVSALERLLALVLHISLSVLVFQVFARKKWRWLLVAIAYHAIIDFTVVLVAFSDLNLHENLQVALAEGITAVFALISFGIIFVLRQPANNPLQEEE